MLNNGSEDSFSQLVSKELYDEIIGNELLSDELGRHPEKGFSYLERPSWEIVMALMLFPFFFYLIHLLIWNFLIE
jgi:hypothetical protein